MSWASRIISVVLLFDLTLTLGQLTCDYSLYSRFRCTRFARGAVVTPAQCRAAGCCYDLFSTAAPSTRCFLAREEVNMRFKPTVHPNTGQQNGLLTLGGLSTRDGNIVVRKCNVANRRPCGNSRTTKSRCESFSCCWHNRTESCHHASHYIIRQKKACEAGFTNPPVCSDIDECASSPCQNGGVCVNLKNKFRCDCPPNIQGTTCTNG
uniref:EGF-like domain-containing protein n=1 Tax=Ciona intestinalis TaxID=7719 RepID=H2XZ81_CIOIN